MSLKLVRSAASPYWQIHGTVAGARVRESSGTADRRLAEEKRAAIEAELFREAVHGPAPKALTVTWEKAALSYTEAVVPSPRTADYLLRLTDLWAGKRLQDIDQAAIDGAVQKLSPKAAPATRLRAFVVPTRAVLMHAARRGWCPPPLFEVPAGAGGNERVRWLTPAEFMALYRAAAEHLKPILLFMVCCGARIGEVLRLQWRDVDLQARRAILREVKSKHGVVRDRTVELLPGAVKMLRAIMPRAAADRTGAVFRGPDGAPYRDTREKTTGGGQIKRAFATACREAGLPGEWHETEKGHRWWQPDDVSPHVLRHTFATWHYCVFRDPLRLLRDGGWSTQRQVERYAKLAPDRLRPAILRAWGVTRPAELGLAKF